ncbi:hypothetical protein POM88_012035 [Heracleum sosnowskyi]|uniref:Uncharacterized protein n=1 Tax=Heracleum sosnowskyi TaxID=360622 RepID=A0AAD8IVN7_9APIA|nr:hypothetical protein POM88_012035 [Heracleum sosnowskyi]
MLYIGQLLSVVNCWLKCMLLDPYTQSDNPECKSHADTGLSAITEIDPGYITEGYFHTVICNNDEYRHTAISHDLHYIAWDSPPKQHPKSLTIKDFDNMVNSSAPFARKFAKDDPVLDKIDKELLGRINRFPLESWCISSSEGGVDICSSIGPGAERLKMLTNKLLSREFGDEQCKL